MQYKLSNDGNRRSEAYRGTVFSKDDPNVKAIKADVARHNKVIRENTRLYGSSPCGQTLQRVSIMARGTRRDAQKVNYYMETPTRPYSTNMVIISISISMMITLTNMISIVK